MNDPELSSAGWDNVRITTRRPPSARPADADPAGARFLIGIVIFLAVAAVYPWYSYKVQTTLAARDIREAIDGVERDAKRELSRLDRQLAQATAQQQARDDQQRVQQVRVIGASLADGSPVVIVDMGSAELPESTPTICRQAARWLDRPVSGAQLKVRQHRGKAPAIGIGTIRC